jgi:hypothetical protein
MPFPTKAYPIPYNQKNREGGIMKKLENGPVS